MIDTSKFYKSLRDKGVDFFTGVPDSLLKDFCAYITDYVSEDKHILAANEGNAIGLAVGNYLATGKLPFVYMQNSGFGNAVNPLLSIADEDVYSIPLLLMIGWRGEPGFKDEPQHIKQGKVSESLLEAMGIPYQILDANSDIEKVLSKATSIAMKENKPYALLVRKNTFSKYKLQKEIQTNFSLDREAAIKLIIDQLEDDDIVISTTGKTSREVFEYREELNQTHEKDFLTVGAMGHTSSIAMGVALENKDRNVYCLDGDGSAIMQMGSFAINGTIRSISNFKHIILNNGAHDSVGGQPTVAFNIDMPKIASSCGYSFVNSASDETDIKEKLEALKKHKGIAFLELKVNKGARENLGRPTVSPKDNKKAFQKFLK